MKHMSSSCFLNRCNVHFLITSFDFPITNNTLHGTKKDTMNVGEVDMCEWKKWMWEIYEYKWRCDEIYIKSKKN